METLIFITCYVGIGFIISIISEIAYFLLKNTNYKPSKILFSEEIPTKSRLAVMITWPVFAIVILFIGIKE